MSLNVIALISGGKDSLFSLLHCIANGHKIIALGNLYPAPTVLSDEEDGLSKFEGEDLNSFMYQTVGHTMIPAYAEALGLPLYRCQISGTAVHTGRYYAFSEDGNPDETEDLIFLLQNIKRDHPDVNAVSTGAILSTYQRTRVESVALRLGLMSIAYLWQYPTLPPPLEREDSITGLLDDMEAAGCDARLIKIAGAGIKESLLGSRISDPTVASRLVAGMSRFNEGGEYSLRGALLGEGGEYETLALNGPPRVWKRRIEVDSTNNTIIADEGGATRLIFGKTALVEQRPGLVEEGSSLVRVPVLLDEKFKLLAERLSKAKESTDAHCMKQASGQWNSFRTSVNLNSLKDPNHGSKVTEQTTAIILKLDDQLKLISTSTDNRPRVAFTTILLRHLSDFAAVNTIYGKLFNHTNPPARVTICCGDTLPEGVLISMSFTLTKVEPARINALHVQSISYWAPANIGPYSQAISLPIPASQECSMEVVHLAGQIPLVPSSMTLLEADFLDQAILSLQHLWRVGHCASIDWWTHGVAYLADAEPDEIQRRVQIAWETWQGANEAASNQLGEVDEEASDDDDGNLDVWDMKFNRQLSQQQSRQSSKRRACSHLHTLPNHNVLIRDVPSSSSHQGKSSRPAIPPFLAAHVSSLPRSAPIEWHSLGLAHLPKYPASNPCITISTKLDEEHSTSISTCSLDLRETLNSGTESDDQEEKEEEGEKKPHHQFAKRLQITESKPALEFFSIQIFPPGPPPNAHPPSPPSTNKEDAPSSPSAAASLIQSFTSALSHIFPSSTTTTTTTTATTTNNHNNPTTQDHLSNPPSPSANLTIYLSSPAAHDAVAAVGLGEIGVVIPCRSLWGDGGRRVELAVLGWWER